jgi:hypothetical protein
MTEQPELKAIRVIKVTLEIQERKVFQELAVTLIFQL